MTLVIGCCSMIGLRADGVLGVLLGLESRHIAESSQSVGDRHCVPQSACSAALYTLAAITSAASATLLRVLRPA